MIRPNCWVGLCLATLALFVLISPSAGQPPAPGTAPAPAPARAPVPAPSDASPPAAHAPDAIGSNAPAPEKGKGVEHVLSTVVLVFGVLVTGFVALIIYR